MFKASNQPKLFSFENEISSKIGKTQVCSKEEWFYNLILRNINEMDFRELYSGKSSWPNSPVNILVPVFILKELKGD